MVLTRVAGRVPSGATLDRGTGVSVRLARNHPIKGSLDGVLPFPETIITLTLGKRGDESVHGRAILFVGA